MAAVEAVLAGDVDHAYVLSRPPGHHACPESGAGFCIFNNVVLAALHARELGCRRLAIVDWDAHHGNGTQAAFWDDPDVLYISVHQDRYFPLDTGFAEHVGGALAEGSTANVPLPGGAGDGAYALAMRRVVAPLVNEFSQGFRDMTRAVVDAAATAGAGVVCCHEGGYSEGYAPFCLLAIMEELAGWRTPVEDPFLPAIGGTPAARARPHEVDAIEDVVRQHARFWTSL
jgi:acetoin utilization deacetylase AcuC-like enzyme